MEIIILIIANIILSGVIVYLVTVIKKMTENYLDAILQKNAGVYYPPEKKREPQLYEEQDNIDSIPLEDVSDEDFIKAARGNLNGK